MLVGQILQPQLAEGPLDAGPYPLGRPTGVLEREGHLPGGVHVEELRARILEQRSRALGDLPGGQAADVLVVQQDAPAPPPGEEARGETVGHAQQGGFSAAGAPAHNRHLTGAHADGDIMNPPLAGGRIRAVDEGGALEADHATAPQTRAPAIAPRPRRSMSQSTGRMAMCR